MKRRDFLAAGAAFGVAAATRAIGGGAARPAGSSGGTGGSPIEPPSRGPISVAVAISEGVTVIDFTGPWEVFQDVMVPERGGDHENQMPFQLFTVSASKDVVTGSGGLRIAPDHTFESCPPPRVIVVPAQSGSKALHAWLRKASEKADLTMSVCTGAFQLARAGLLSGKTATTHHDFTDDLARGFPDIRVQRGLRFVENGRIATAGGLTSGIDLALRVVERYFGRAVAERTAVYMEYQSKGWIV
jgi:transcriptional regulator GlxA family with amidase domain